MTSVLSGFGRVSDLIDETLRTYDSQTDANKETIAKVDKILDTLLDFHLRVGKDISRNVAICDDAEHPIYEVCTSCPNFDVHYDGQNYCRLSLKGIGGV